MPEVTIFKALFLLCRCVYTSLECGAVEARGVPSPGAVVADCCISPDGSAQNLVGSSLEEQQGLIMAEAAFHPPKVDI